MEKPSLEARNTVILFDSGLNAEFRRMSRLIHERVKSRVVLNDTDMLPHLSLYNTRFPLHNLQAAEERLQDIASNLEPLRLILDKKSVTSGYIFLDAQMTGALREIHERIIAALNPLREDMLDPEDLALPGITDAMKYSLETTGMLLAHNAFQPHVTLARPENIADCAAALDVIPDNFSCEAYVDSIHFVESGQSGTCKKVIRSYRLGQ